MRVTVLMENTVEKGSAFRCEHGLSLLIDQHTRRYLPVRKGEGAEK